MTTREKRLAPLRGFFEELEKGVEDLSEENLKPAILNSSTGNDNESGPESASGHKKEEGTGLKHLHIAVLKGSVGVVQRQIESKADLNDTAYAPNKYCGLSCLHLAIAFKHQDIQKLLHKSNCKTEQCLLFTSEDFKLLNGLTPLHLALLYQDSEAVELLLKHKAVLNSQTLCGFSPLHLAAYVNNEEMTRKFLQLGVMKNTYTKYGANAFHIAAESGSLDVLKILHENGLAFDKRTIDGFTPLHAAVQNGCPAVVDFLCNLGYDLELRTSVQGDGERKLTNATVLHLAADKAYAKCVKVLLNHGADPSAVCEKSEENENLTALHLAAIRDSKKICKRLINHGADINAVTKSGLTPLFFAVLLKRTKIVKLLLKQKGIGVNKCVGNSTTSPLIYAIEKKYDNIAKLLIAHPEINLEQRVVWTEPDGDIHRRVTPIHLAVMVKSSEIVKCLVEHGADVKTRMEFNDGEELDVTLMVNVMRYRVPNVADVLYEAGTPLDVKTNEGITPLMMAVEDPHIEMIKFLIGHGVDVNVKDDLHEMTALMRTCEDGFVQATKVLLDSNRCDLDLQDDEGLTALHSAITYGHKVIAHMLLDYGCNVDLKSRMVNNRDRLTPLILAIEYCDERMVHRLLKMGADPNAKFMRGFTPLHLAAQLNKVGMMKSLLKYGANMNNESTRGETPLHFALYFESQGAADLLIRRGAHLHQNGEIASYLSGTPIHYAAYRAQIEMMDLLVDFGAEIYSIGSSSRDNKDVSPLYFATRGMPERSVMCMQKLVDLGCDVNARNAFRVPVVNDSINGDESTIVDDRLKILLRHGADFDCTDRRDNIWRKVTTSGTIDQLRYLLQAGLNFGRPGDESDSYPVLFSKLNCSMELWKLLINFGVDPTHVGPDELSPVHEAVVRNLDENLEYLIACGSPLDRKGSYAARLKDAMPLHVAAVLGNEKSLKILIKAGVDVNAVCSYYEKEDSTAMHICARLNDVDVAEILLEYGCDPNTQNAEGQTPLFMAVDHDSDEVFHYLLRGGCSFDIGTHMTVTPLIHAAHKGNFQMVQALVLAGANVNAVGSFMEDTVHDISYADFTALHVAAERGYVNIVRLLIEAGAHIDAVQCYDEKFGYTPFLNAVKRGKREVIKVLAEEKCNINAQLEDGKSALHLAVEESSMELAKHLIDLGIDPTLQTNLGQLASSIAQSTEFTHLLISYEASWNLKHRRPSLSQKRPSLHQRMSLRVIEEFSTRNFGADAVNEIRQETDVTDDITVN